MSWIRDEEKVQLLFIQEGKTKMNFVRIGKRVINLANVTEVRFQRNGGMSGNKPCVIISYVGDTDSYSAVYKEDEPETFSALMTWMDEQPALLSEE